MVWSQNSGTGTPPIRGFIIGENGRNPGNVNTARCFLQTSIQTQKFVNQWSINEVIRCIVRDRMFPFTVDKPLRTHTQSQQRSMSFGNRLSRFLCIRQVTAAISPSRRQGREKPQRGPGKHSCGAHLGRKLWIFLFIMAHSGVLYLSGRRRGPRTSRGRLTPPRRACP